MLNALSSWFANGLFFFFFFLTKKSYDLSVMSYAEWLASHSDDLHLMFTKLCWISSAILNKKVTSAYEYHGGSTEPEPRHTFQEAHGACAVTHLHCEWRHNHAQEPVPLGNSRFPYFWEKVCPSPPPPSPADSIPCGKVILQNPSFVSQWESSSKQLEDNSHQTYGKHFIFTELPHANALLTRIPER